MRRNDSLPDRELARALRRLDPPVPTQSQMSALAHRIMVCATPLLDARRRGASTWWEYAAAWAGTLLPLGAAAAFVAAACLVWSTTARAPIRPHAVERTALLRAVTNGAPSGDLIDIVLDARSAEQAAGARGGRGDDARR